MSTDQEKPVKNPHYAIYLGVGDLPPREAKAYLRQQREVLAPVFGGKCLFVPVRGADSRIEVLKPNTLQERAWDFFMHSLAGKITAVPSDQLELAKEAFQAARAFAEVEAQEMRMISKPCPECGGTGEMEGLAASDIEE